jgi:hypothetical protein
MDNKVIRIPIRWKQRWRNRMGDRAVQCQVSNRWIQFPEGSSRNQGEDWMLVYVMTLDANEKPRKLCELVVTRQDILHALEHVAQS